MLITAIVIISKIFLFIYTICSMIALFGISLYRKDLSNAFNEFYSRCPWEKSPFSINFAMYLACIIPVLNINTSIAITIFALKKPSKQRQQLMAAVEKLVLESKEKFKIK